ncbi:hypothetical protein D3C76_1577670 [compost metagenome]
MEKGKEKVFDIGGIYKLELVQCSSGSGFHGEYTVVRTGKVFTFDGSGMTQKQILKRFWDHAKRSKEASA